METNRNIASEYPAVASAFVALYEAEQAWGDASDEASLAVARGLHPMVVEDLRRKAQAAQDAVIAAQRVAMDFERDALAAEAEAEAEREEHDWELAEMRHEQAIEARMSDFYGGMPL